MATVADTAEKVDSCSGCGEDNYSGLMYCRQQRTSSCVMCGEEFEYFCKDAASKKKTCSKSCSSKLIRSDKKHVVQCLLCEKDFNSYSQAMKYCNQDIRKECPHCQKEFITVCNQADGSNYCSPRCRYTFMRHNNYRIKKQRQCPICSEFFNPHHSQQVYCDDDHFDSCQYCGDEFLVSVGRYARGDARFCSNSCSSFYQMGSSFDKELLDEYRDPDKWAIEFLNEHGRKPQFSDFTEYFGVNNLPAWINRKRFVQRRDSRLELIVFHFLKKQYEGIEMIRNKRHTFEDGKILELDIWLTELMIGFEIQDFSTHSKTSDEGISKYGHQMKGPIYHEDKRRRFKGIGVKVSDIWEDDIVSKSFEDTVRELVSKEISLLK